MKVSALCCHVFALSILTAAEDAKCSDQDETSCLPPECRWDGDSCRDICFQIRKSWQQDTGEENMPGANRTTAQDAATCQHKCRTTSGCQHFSFWPNDNLKCALQDGDSSEKEDTKAVSGEPDCEQVCFNVSYAYDITTDDGWMTKKGEPETTENSSFACQQRCQKADGCTQFVYWWEEQHCQLLDTNSTDVIYVAEGEKRDIVSGPASCVQAPTPAPAPNTTAPPAPTPAPADNSSCESSPCGPRGPVTREGAVGAVGSIQTWALDDVRPPSWSSGHVSLGGVGVGFGAVAVVFGALVAAVRTCRDSGSAPVMLEEDMLVE